jgi:hypothetical protein
MLEARGDGHADFYRSWIEMEHHDLCLVSHHCRATCLLAIIVVVVYLSSLYMLCILALIYLSF